MKWNKQFNYPKSTKSFVSGSRHYDVNQEKLPSVTAILSATASEEKKAALKAWKERVGHQEAEKIKKEASARGSSMHSFIEQYLLGHQNMQLIEENNQAKKMAQEIIDNGLNDKLTEIWGAEATLHYPKLYAGTADCIGVYQGQESILDFKQSNKPKIEQFIEDYFLQLAAYSLAHNKVYSTKITQGVVLICTVDNLFQSFKIEDEKLIKYEKRFLEKVNQYYEQQSKNK